MKRVVIIAGAVLSFVYSASSTLLSFRYASGCIQQAWMIASTFFFLKTAAPVLRIADRRLTMRDHFLVVSACTSALFAHSLGLTSAFTALCVFDDRCQSWWTAFLWAFVTSALGIFIGGIWMNLLVDSTSLFWPVAKFNAEIFRSIHSAGKRAGSSSTVSARISRAVDDGTASGESRNMRKARGRRQRGPGDVAGERDDDRGGGGGGGGGRQHDRGHDRAARHGGHGAHGQQQGPQKYGRAATKSTALADPAQLAGADYDYDDEIGVLGAHYAVPGGAGGEGVSDDEEDSIGGDGGRLAGGMLGRRHPRQIDRRHKRGFWGGDGDDEYDYDELHDGAADSGLQDSGFIVDFNRAQPQSENGQLPNATTDARTAASGRATTVSSSSSMRTSDFDLGGRESSAKFGADARASSAISVVGESSMQRPILRPSSGYNARVNRGSVGGTTANKGDSEHDDDDEQVGVTRMWGPHSRQQQQQQQQQQKEQEQEQQQQQQQQQRAQPFNREPSGATDVLTLPFGPGAHAAAAAIATGGAIAGGRGEGESMSEDLDRLQVDHEKAAVKCWRITALVVGLWYLITNVAMPFLVSMPVLCWVCSKQACKVLGEGFIGGGLPGLSLEPAILASWAVPMLRTDMLVWLVLGVVFSSHILQPWLYFSGSIDSDTGVSDGPVVWMAGYDLYTKNGSSYFDVNRQCEAFSDAMSCDASGCHWHSSRKECDAGTISVSGSLWSAVLAVCFVFIGSVVDVVVHTYLHPHHGEHIERRSSLDLFMDTEESEDVTETRSTISLDAASPHMQTIELTLRNAGSVMLFRNRHYMHRVDDSDDVDPRPYFSMLLEGPVDGPLAPSSPGLSIGAEDYATPPHTTPHRVGQRSALHGEADGRRGQGGANLGVDQHASFEENSDNDDVAPSMRISASVQRQSDSWTEEDTDDDTLESGTGQSTKRKHTRQVQHVGIAPRREIQQQQPPQPKPAGPSSSHNAVQDARTPLQVPPRHQQAAVSSRAASRASCVTDTPKYLAQDGDTPENGLDNGGGSRLPDDDGNDSDGGDRSSSNGSDGLDSDNDSDDGNGDGDIKDNDNREGDPLAESLLNGAVAVEPGMLHAHSNDGDNSDGALEALLPVAAESPERFPLGGAEDAIGNENATHTRRGTHRRGRDAPHPWWNDAWRSVRRGFRRSKRCLRRAARQAAHAVTDHSERRVMPHWFMVAMVIVLSVMEVYVVRSMDIGVQWEYVIATIAVAIMTSLTVAHVWANTAQQMTISLALIVGLILSVTLSGDEKVVISLMCLHTVLVALAVNSLNDFKTASLLRVPLGKVMVAQLWGAFFAALGAATVFQSVMHWYHHDNLKLGKQLWPIVGAQSARLFGLVLGEYGIWRVLRDNTDLRWFTGGCVLVGILLPLLRRRVSARWRKFFPSTVLIGLGAVAPANAFSWTSALIFALVVRKLSTHSFEVASWWNKFKPVVLAGWQSGLVLGGAILFVLIISRKDDDGLRLGGPAKDGCHFHSQIPQL